MKKEKGEKELRRPRLALLLLFSFFLLPFVAGCSGCNRTPDAYPAEFDFAARQSWIVIDLPKDIPTQLEPQGELDEGIRRINARGGKVLDPATVPLAFRQELDTFLRDTFGTPATPTISGDEETRNLAESRGLSNENLAAGSRLFRERCQECHGANGDGRGVTAPWLTPHPRDFRTSAFKFVSTGRKPTRADLFRTITFGLKPTAMPSFGMRSEDDRNRLIDYVMFLSLRGRTELDVLKLLLVHGEDGLNGDVASEAAAVLKSELRAWANAESQVIPAVPPEYSDGSPEHVESIRRGQAIFVDAKGGACATCHFNYGRDAKLQYDIWGTLIRPTNLTEIRRKGGDGPAEQYRRIRGGIHPSNMPAASSLNDRQTWDLVNFLRALPYPDRLPEDIKEKIYKP